LIVSDEHGGPLLPIMLLAHEHDPDPAKRPKPLSPDKRRRCLSYRPMSSRVCFAVSSGIWRHRC
jgi:hypothetical protein